MGDPFRACLLFPPVMRSKQILMAQLCLVLSCLGCCSSFGGRAAHLFPASKSPTSCLAGTCFLKQEEYGTLCQCLSILSRLHAVVSWEFGRSSRGQGDAELFLQAEVDIMYGRSVLCLQRCLPHFDSKANLSLKSNIDYEEEAQVFEKRAPASF